jgi:hypothetical protein
VAIFTTIHPAAATTCNTRKQVIGWLASVADVDEQDVAFRCRSEVGSKIPLAAFDRSGVVRVAWAIDYVCYPVCCGHFHCRARWGALLHQVRLVIVKHIHMLPRI